MDSALVLLPLVAVVVSALAVAGAVRRRVLAWEWALGCSVATALLLIILWATFSPFIALRGAGWTLET
jgi:hypothetical protein